MQQIRENILRSLPKDENKRFFKSVVYCIIPLSSLPVKSYLCYVAACNFTEKQLHHFCMNL